MVLSKTPAPKRPTILIAVDFSDCVGAAFRKARSLAAEKQVCTNYPLKEFSHEKIWSSFHFVDFFGSFCIPYLRGF